jgi:hypothetical protein
MSAGDLRKEFLKLQKEFVGGQVSKLKKHEVQHRLDVLKKAMTFKDSDASPAPARTGPANAREIPTKEVSIDGETTVKKPLKPEGPDPIPNPPRGPKKIKPMEVKEPKVAAEPKEQKAPKKRLVPPKVVFDEASIKEPKVKKEKKPKSKATAEPNTAPPAPEAAPLIVTVEKLPGGCRKISED